MTHAEPFTIGCISLWQPWATMVMYRKKRYETRSKPPYASFSNVPIVIHAAKKWNTRLKGIAEGLNGDFDLGLTEMVLGAALGIATITAFYRTEDIFEIDPDQLYGIEQYMGDYSAGRYAWKLDHVCAFACPIPLIGHQYFWHWTPEGDDLAVVQAALAS